MQKKNLHLIMNILAILSLVACAAFIVYGIQTRIFFSQKELAAFLGRFGRFAPIVFVFFQATQVIFPVLPGGIGLLGGPIFFGPMLGFVYNYLGICLGSIASFLVSKKYGTSIMESLFSSKVREKYMHWAESKKFTTLFAIAILMPVAPDDFLCYLAGTTKMPLWKFSTIIVLCKPATLLVYSFGLYTVWQQILNLVQPLF